MSYIAFLADEISMSVAHEDFVNFFASHRFEC